MSRRSKKSRHKQHHSSFSSVSPAEKSRIALATAMTDGYIVLRAAEVLIGRYDLEIAHARISHVILSSWLLSSKFENIVMRSKYVANSTVAERQAGIAPLKEYPGHLVCLASAEGMQEFLRSDMAVLNLGEGSLDYHGEFVEILGKVCEVGLCGVTSLEGVRELQVMALGQVVVGDGRSSHLFKEGASFGNSDEDLDAMAYAIFLYLTACLALQNNLSKLDFVINWRELAPDDMPYTEEDKDIGWRTTVCRYRLMPYSGEANMVQLPLGSDDKSDTSTASPGA